MNPLSRLLSWLSSTSPIDPDTLAGLQRVVEVVDKVFAMTPGFDEKLAEPVAHALAYCASLVDALPPPVDVGRQHFAADPLVHAFFASADDIGDMLAASAPVRAYLADPQSYRSDSFFGLMAARHTEKQVLGVAMQHGIMATDVPQSLLLLSDRALVFPAADADTARAALRAAAFDSLLRTFAGHIELARVAYTSLQSERELERVRLRSHPADGRANFPSRYIAALDERLRRQFESLQPDAVVAELAGFLMQPEEALSLNPVQLWVTRAGVIQNGDVHDADAAEIRFMELTSRDRRRHAVLPVRIRCDEAREALERAREVRESMLLI
ncbi:MAG: hypothetical protein LBP58_07520 [Azoarcus sp.]|jgi:hypothetical protein|nr:hypothetical protein [Azoarcus sp.]